MKRLGWVMWCAVALIGFGGNVEAQSATTMVQLPIPLLGPKMGNAVRTGDAVTGSDPAQADSTNAAILKEDGLQRFSSATYGKAQVKALQFNDASGAYSAFTSYVKNGAAFLHADDKSVNEVATAGNRKIFLAQTVVLLAEESADATTLRDIVAALPKVSGPSSQRPLLPTLLPARGLVNGSERYALGPAAYSSMGGALPAEQLGWEKSGEAVTVQYADGRGKETLTLLLYPTPQIAGDHTRSLEKLTAGSAKVRREGELVAVAQGTFSADAAQNMIENIHLRSEVTFDKPLPPSFPIEIRKTYSLIKSIAILSGVGGLAAVLLGLFLGGGRAAFRVMRGKDAATDAEFLSLHLDPQNDRPRFGPPA